MRVRALDANGDMTFGFSQQNFLVNSPEAVAQCVLTSLRLSQGEWFLDTTAGMPWNTKVLGFNTQATYDTAIQNCVRGVEGVTDITSYSSSFNPQTRVLTVTIWLSTAFGSTTVSTSFAPPLTGGYGVGGYAVNPYGE